MTYALIDNATLTAVQRVVGQAPVRNRDTINGDLAALESFVQTVLFYDEVICLDDYKPEFKAQRQQCFPAIRFVDPTQHGLNDVALVARREAAASVPTIRAGQFEDDAMKAFFETLKMNAICTWDMRSSMYYLTMKILGKPGTEDTDRFKQLSASIYGELADSSETTGRWSTDAKLIGSNGTAFTKEYFESERGSERGVTRALEMFIASLNWLSYKTIYYSLAAQYLQADTCLHPIRHAYQLNWMKRRGVLGADFSAKILLLMTDELQSAHEDIVDHGRGLRLNLNIPLFSAWLMRETGDPAAIPAAATELRNDPLIADVRSLLRDVRVPYDQGNLTEANKATERWRKNVKKAGDDLRSRFGIRTAQGLPLSPLIQVVNTVGAVKGLPSLPDFGLKLPEPSFLRSNERKAFGALFKDVASDLIWIERLGSIRDQLSSKFTGLKDAYEGGFKTEDPAYRWATSFWKRPM